MKQSLASTIEHANISLIALGAVETIPEFFSADYIAHFTGQDLARGHDGIREVIASYHKAFRDFDIKVEILVEHEDRIAWQRTIRATQKGAFRGFPASGREIVWRDMVTSRIHDGLIAEEWVVTDLAERLLLARKR